jgi:hypothetical protein
VGRDAEVKHLSEQEIVACSKCQRQYDDVRWSLSLRPLPGPAEEGHPSHEELAAFWSDALSPAPARRIQRHVRGCSRCLALYRRFREDGQARAYSSPAPELMRRVQQQFSSRPSPVDLGVLLLRRVGEALKLTHEPAEPSENRVHFSAWKMDQLLEESPAPVRRLAQPGSWHPSSARARRRRRERETKGQAVDRLEGLEASNDSARYEPVRLEAEELMLSLNVVSENDQDFLTIRVVQADTGRVARHVTLRARSSSGDEVRIQTDERGQANIPMSEGLSRLVILARRPLLLEVRNVG